MKACSSQLTPHNCTNTCPSTSSEHAQCLLFASGLHCTANVLSASALSTVWLQLLVSISLLFPQVSTFLWPSMVSIDASDIKLQDAIDATSAMPLRDLPAHCQTLTPTLWGFATSWTRCWTSSLFRWNGTKLKPLSETMRGMSYL